MKITEVWDNLDAFKAAVKANDPSISSWNELQSATTEAEVINVVAKYFYWCVRCGILEEWLPAKLDCEWLDCTGCAGLTVLPELPESCRVYR